MGILTKLFDELAPASVLREKVSLFKEKLSIFEAKHEALERKLENTNREIESLKKLNQELQRTAEQKKGKLDKVTEQILQQFFDLGRDLSVEHFVSSLSLDINTVEYHFDILREREYIDLASVGLDLPGCSGSEKYSISPEGRKFIFEKSNT